MKIIPTTSENGLKYKVVSKSIWGRYVLCKHVGMVSVNDRIALHFCEPMYFDFVHQAVKEIRKQFGETADIECWEPKT